jgi:transposase
MNTDYVGAHTLSPSLPPNLIAPPPPLRKPRRRRKTVIGVTPVENDFLGLPGLRTTATPEIGDFYIRVKAQQEKVASCPHCGCDTKQFKHNGTRTRPQLLLDEPRGFRRVLIELTRRTFRCAECNKSGLLPLSGVGKKERMTARLASHIEHMSLLRPHAEVALMTGISRRKVREVFDAYMPYLKKTVDFEPPRVIGLDSLEIRGKGCYAVVTDIERRLVLRMWKYAEEGEKNKTLVVRTLSRKLKRMAGTKHVEVVVIDMSSHLSCAVEKALPQAKIVIDRFHIQRMANEAMHAARRRVNKSLNEDERKSTIPRASVFCKRREHLTGSDRAYLKKQFSQYPALRLAYKAKEDFCRMWESASAAEAKQFYERWSLRLAVVADKRALYEILTEDFAELRSAMKNWGKYVYNYFDLKEKYTNAFTEWSNRRIRDVWRESRGCGIGVLRSKLIFGTWLMRRMRLEREWWGEGPSPTKRHRTPSPQPVETEGGAKATKRARTKKRVEKAKPRRPFTSVQMSFFE